MTYEKGMQYYLQHKKESALVNGERKTLTSMEIVVLEKFVFEAGREIPAKVVCKTMNGHTIVLDFPTQSLIPISSKDKFRYYGTGKYGICR